MTEQSLVERRRFPRIAVDFVVLYRPAGGGKGALSREDRLLTLCEGGCFIQSKLTYPRGTQLDIRLKMEEREFQVKGFVVYSVQFNPKVETVQFPGMGISFEGVPDLMAQAIRKLVAKEQLKTGLGVSQ